MKKMEAETLKSKIPEKYRKSWLLGGMGTIIGAGVGGYLAATKHNLFYAGLGAVIGAIVGDVIGLMLCNALNLNLLTSYERRSNFTLGIFSYCLVIVCIVFFFIKKEWILLIGALVFVLCGTYLISKKD